MAEILVTGAAGFIGSTLAGELLLQGHHVTGIDNLNRYYSPELKRRNLEALKKSREFKFILGSVLDKSALKKTGKVEVVFHEAAVAGVRPSLKKPMMYLENNTIGTLRLLEHFRDVERFIYASTSSVYGDVPESQLPIKESQEKRPISPYGLSKLHGEQWCKLFSRLYGLKTVSLRLFTVYGPRQRPDEAIGRFISAMLSGNPLEIYGDGNQTRDFTFVGDVVNAHILAMEKGEGVYNIGSGKSITVNELVKAISRVTGKNPKIIHTEKQAGDVENTRADITLARNDLGYGPKQTLESGLKKHTEWIKENTKH